MAAIRSRTVQAAWPVLSKRILSAGPVAPLPDPALLPTQSLSRLALPPFAHCRSGRLLDRDSRVRVPATGIAPRAVHPASARTSANDPGARPRTSKPFLAGPWHPAIATGRSREMEEHEPHRPSPGDGRGRQPFTEPACQEPGAPPTGPEPEGNRRAGGPSRKPGNGVPPSLLTGRRPGSSLTAPGTRDLHPSRQPVAVSLPRADLIFRMRGGKPLAPAVRSVLCWHRPARPVVQPFRRATRFLLWIFG